MDLQELTTLALLFVSLLPECVLYTILCITTPTIHQYSFLKDKFSI